jgi:DNA-binding winged helix-turn-helix (wHTH) protein
LLQAVWGDTFVEEGNLKQYVSHLRKAMGDNSEDTRLIVTIARKGYQFTADVTAYQALAWLCAYSFTKNYRSFSYSGLDAQFTRYVGFSS